MLFVVEKLLWLVAQPSTALLLLAWIGVLLLRRHRRAGLRCILACLICYSAIALLPVNFLLLAPLENRFPAVKTLPANVTGIIVLGGAVSPSISQWRGQPSLNDDAERMTSLVYLARQYPQARLAFTGGNGTLLHGRLAEADVARQLFTELGVDQSRMVYEGRSRTTYENAVLLKAMLHPQPGQTWLLVTSAWHMPRSVGLFRHAGWQVLAYPVAYKTTLSPITMFQEPFPQRLQQVDIGVHEWIGLLAYWLMGRTSALLPGP